MLGPYRGVDKKEFPGLNSEVCWYAAAFPWSVPDTCTHRHHMRSTLSSTQQHTAPVAVPAYRLTTVTGSYVGAEKVQGRRRRWPAQCYQDHMYC